MLPLYRESAHTPAMVKHCLKQSIAVTNFMNPGQIPVNFCDQPLYAISKPLQWQHAELDESKSLSVRKYVLEIANAIHWI